MESINRSWKKYIFFCLWFEGEAPEVCFLDWIRRHSAVQYAQQVIPATEMAYGPVPAYHFRRPTGEINLRNCSFRRIILTSFVRPRSLSKTTGLAKLFSLRLSALRFLGTSINQNKRIVSYRKTKTGPVSPSGDTLDNRFRAVPTRRHPIYVGCEYSNPDLPDNPDLWTWFFMWLIIIYN